MEQGAGRGSGMTNWQQIRVLLIDDEPAIRRALVLPLRELGFQVSEAASGEDALLMMRTTVFDAALLDVNMPGMVRALDLGADDYVTKPFSTTELIARIRAAVRRYKAPTRATDAPIEIGEIRLDPVKRTVTKRGQTLHVTRKEFDILHCLMSRAGRAITYGKLLAAVWGGDAREEIEYLRTYVNQLRKKIEDDPSKPTYLLTDVYVGYRFASADMFRPDDEGAEESVEMADFRGA
jgi:two-component system KDP operon response regulator KdpE